MTANAYTYEDINKLKARIEKLEAALLEELKSQERRQIGFSDLAGLQARNNLIQEKKNER